MKVFIKDQADYGEAMLVRGSHNIPERTRWLFSNMMIGNFSYYPRTGGRGQNVICKSDGCKNYAMAGARKQLCPAHYPAFLERSNKVKALPKCCECGANTKMEYEGRPFCIACTRNKEAYDARIREALDKRQTKALELEDCQTVDELRAWIKEYVL